MTDDAKPQAVPKCKRCGGPLHTEVLQCNGPQPTQAVGDEVDASQASLESELRSDKPDTTNFKRTWYLDATSPFEGPYCFCPVDVDGEGIVTGLNFIGMVPPNGERVVGAFHEDGQEAVERDWDKWLPIMQGFSK
jgi:hypothetical protein